MEIPLFGLSSSYAAAVMEIQVHLATMDAAVAAIIAVYGLSFFFSSAVVAVAETVSANIAHKSDGLSVAFFLSNFIIFDI